MREEERAEVSRRVQGTRSSGWGVTLNFSLELKIINS